MMRRGGRTKEAITADKRYKALKAGRRVSEDGNVYYESRANRSDVSRRDKLADGGELGMPEWYVTITSEDGDTYDWQGFSKNEDDALYKAEKEAGFESVASSVIMITDADGEKIEYKRGGRTKAAITADKRYKALKAGRRVSEDGNVYYESRANRSDVSRRDKLADGGMMARGGAVKKKVASKSNPKPSNKVGKSIQDKHRFAKPAGWRWKEEAFEKRIIERKQLAMSPSKKMRDKYPNLVYFEDRLNKADAKPTRTSADSI
jgi:hypothetical protein